MHDAVLAALPLASLTEWADGLSQQLSQSLAGASLPFAILVFFLGGVLASLTPCVYPMIPIVVAYMGGAETAAVVAGAPGGSRRARVVSRALAYVVGMAIVYTALGLAAALFGRTFGGMTQTWWAYALVGVVLVAFGLSLMGLFEIRMPSFLMNRASGGPKGGLVGAAFMGATSAVVAAPCAGPIVFALLGIVTQQGQVVLGAAGMFAFSLGLGLLFLVIGIFSGMAASLPRPGGWMVTLKKIVGALMIAISLYFFYQGYRLW